MRSTEELQAIVDTPITDALLVAQPTARQDREDAQRELDMIRESEEAKARIDAQKAEEERLVQAKADAAKAREELVRAAGALDRAVKGLSTVWEKFDAAARADDIAQKAVGPTRNRNLQTRLPNIMWASLPLAQALGIHPRFRTRHTSAEDLAR